MSGLGRRKPDPDHISQVQRSVVEPSPSLAAGLRRAIRSGRLCEWEFAHKILEKDWKRRG